MPKSIDRFLDRKYSKEYDCLDFVCEVWSYLTGESLDGRLKLLMSSCLDHSLTSSIVKQFKRLSKPESPCLVLLRGPGVEPHVGIFYETRILHLPKQGVEFQLLDNVARWYPWVEYYR